MWPKLKSHFLFFLIFILTTTFGTQMVWRYSYDQLLTEHQLQLERFSGHIQARLDKYAHIPRLLAQDKALIFALRSPDNTAQLDITNRYLEEVNSSIQASDTYLIDVKGDTIASSNWSDEKSFVGRNFSWRPYFQQAVAGEESQYFALGSTSGLRGYYYSSPVIYAAEVIGVVVVKMDLSQIEQHWQSDSSYFVATDSNNVVFMSSRPEWLFHSVIPLSPATLQMIRDSKQYLDRTIRSLGFHGQLDSAVAEWLDQKEGWIKGDYIVTSRTLAPIPLDIRVLTPKIVVFWDSFGFAVITTMAFIIIYLIMLLLAHRQAKQRQIEQLQSEAKQKLEFLVLERTAELHAEIAERTKAEDQLRKTQDELIQAAKLAVLGQMSASISHELNNPLAAIRSFADNARRFIVKDKIDRVDENLIRISSLTERMAKISTQLKSFARKTDASDRVTAQLNPLLLTVKELMQPQFKSHFSTLSVHVAEPDERLYINTVQLEQVLINLLTNALQAISDCDYKQVIVSTRKLGGSHISIDVEDSGPGIDETQQMQIFEPFYTTKKNGLGLGLSISKQIVESLQGEIFITHSEQLSGAKFSLVFPLSASTENLE
jgi:two-component system C4-dicarboxylate transport sensor histidine kinase DctB